MHSKSLCRVLLKRPAFFAVCSLKCSVVFLNQVHRRAGEPRVGVTKKYENKRPRSGGSMAGLHREHRLDGCTADGTSGNRCTAPATASGLRVGSSRPKAKRKKSAALPCRVISSEGGNVRRRHRTASCASGHLVQARKRKKPVGSSSGERELYIF